MLSFWTKKSKNSSKQDKCAKIVQKLGFKNWFKSKNSPKFNKNHKNQLKTV